MLLEIRQRVNVRSEKPIEGIKLAVREGHLQKKLKDAELKGGMDCHQESNQILLFLLEKVPAGEEMDEEELQHYALLQRIMELVKKELLAMDFVCGELSPADGMLTEWEYDVFGGFNGLSIGLKLVD